MKNYSDLISDFIKNQEILKKLSNNSYEVKGVLFSEVAFIYLVLLGSNFSKLIESGRARAQSTTLLAGLYPNKKIVTIEYDKNSTDNITANQRLSNFKNVETIYGDSFIEIPKILEDGDTVFIDGPKMFQAIILGLQTLKTGKVKYVFLHDMHASSQERWFIDTFIPNSLHSDNTELASHTKILDEKIWNTIPDYLKYDTKKPYSYGFNVSALVFNPNANYSLKIVLAHFFDYYFRIVNKIFG